MTGVEINIEEQTQWLLEASSNSPVQEARESLLARVQSTDLESSLSVLFAIIIRAAQEALRAQQEWLVQFLISLKQAPLVVEAREKKIWTMTWSDDELPLFGATMRESIDTAHESIEKFVNFSSFTAQITRAKVDEDDYLLYGLWTIREALEDPSDKDLAAPSNDLIISLAGAAAWLSEAGDLVYQGCKNDHAFEGRMGALGATAQKTMEQKEDVKGLSINRWTFWQERLEKSSENSYCKQALDAMKKAESSS